MEEMGDAALCKAGEAVMQLVRGRNAVSGACANETDVGGTIMSGSRACEIGRVSHGGAKAAREEGVVSNREGEEDR